MEWASGSGRRVAGKGVVVREWAGWPGWLADCGELRAEKRRDDSFPESGTGVIGIGVSVRFGWRRIVRAPGYPDDTPYD